MTPADRSIGTGAPGLGRAKPHPGRSAHLLVETVYLWHDGHVTRDEDFTTIWHGHTARSACAQRVKGLREAGVDLDVHGPTSLTVRHDRGRWVEQQKLTWTDWQEET